MSLGVESYQHASSLLPNPAILYGDGSLRVFDESASLAKRGFNKFENDILNSIESKRARKDYLRNNLETTINHVFADSAVSFTNNYQMNKEGEVISDGTVLHVDEDERGGFIEYGIKDAVSTALNNPNNVVLFYSPPGPVVFDTRPNNKFRNVKQYPDGQLYIMYSDGIEYVGGKKVNNVAVSISPEGEAWIKEIMPKEYSVSQNITSQIEQIKYFITTPSLTGKSIDAFMSTQSNLQDMPIFINKDNARFSLYQVLALLHQSLAGKLKKSPLVEQIIKQIDFDDLSSKTIEWAYGMLAQKYMEENGIETLTLGGFCGGDTVSMNPLSDVGNILSSGFRLITQGPNIFKLSKDYKDDPNLCRCGAASGPHFHCPGINNKTKQLCSHAIEVGNGTTNCPACGTGKTC